MGSVAYFVSMSIASLSEGGKKGGSFLKSCLPCPSMTLRYLKAKKQCEKEGRGLMPKDLFRAEGISVRRNR